VAVAGSERQREIRRRRHRKQKLGVFKRRAEGASESEKKIMAQKIRNLTPGGEVVIANLGLEG
jgi:hypothetical protein